MPRVVVNLAGGVVPANGLRTTPIAYRLPLILGPALPLALRLAMALNFLLNINRRCIA